MSQTRGSFSQARSSDVERIIAAAEVDTTFAGKKNIRYRGRRSVSSRFPHFKMRWERDLTKALYYY
jgi:hypothetical protein